jgi:hypothetical protein
LRNLSLEEPDSSLKSAIGLFTDTVNEKIKSQSDIQKEWFINYLEQFKREMLVEVENKLNSLMLNLSSQGVNATANNNQLSSLVGLNDQYDLKSLEEKATKLIDLLIEARICGRNLKAAFIEEELDSLGYIKCCG